MISIIIPIFNAEAYLDACLASLVRQTEQDLQIIAVDDGSTDGSLVIAKAYAEQDTRVEVYEQAHAGQSAARNLGMTHAKGDFIAFVDADDGLEPDWCAQHLAAIEGVDYVQSGYKRIKPGTLSSQLSTLNSRLPHSFTSPCMRLYRRQTIADMRFKEGMIYEDVLWSVELWLKDTRCRMIDYTGYLYTLNPNSTTSRPHPEARQVLFRALRDKVRGASLKGKIIILYTLMRLHCHFLRS